jgi:hypothetical protein
MLEGCVKLDEPDSGWLDLARRKINRTREQIYVLTKVPGTRSIAAKKLLPSHLFFPFPRLASERRLEPRSFLGFEQARFQA